MISLLREQYNNKTKNIIIGTLLLFFKDTYSKQHAFYLLDRTQESEERNDRDDDASSDEYGRRINV